MSYWNIESPINNDKAIVGSMYFNATQAVTIEAENVNLNKDGKKVVEAGFFLSNVGGKGRFLPRDYAKAAVTTAENQIVVEHPELFLPGDELMLLEAAGSITVGAGSIGDVVSVRLVDASNGIDLAVSHTLATTTGVEDELVAVINASSSSTYGYLRAETTAAGTVSIYTTGGNFVVSVSGAALTAVTQPVLNTTVVGTVQGTLHATGTLLLEAPAAVAVPQGARIGTLVDKIVGLYNHSKDFSYAPTCELKAIDRCDRVYIAALPYFDRQLALQFPRIAFL